MSITHSTTPPRLVLTPGEPAGIGPDVVIKAAQQRWDAELLCVADCGMMQARAALLGLPLTLYPYTTGDDPQAHQPGSLRCVDVKAPSPVVPGKLDVKNAAYVLATLTFAAELCRYNDAQAMITAPVQKSIINDAGIPFSGHTEFLAEHFECDHVVMLLAAGDLRVALATTHLPLAQIPAALTQPLIENTLRLLHSELQAKFGFARPRITVLGLNPHAGEGGHLGREEVEVITPIVSALQNQGLTLTGPLPADTAFSPAIRTQTDAYLAMYHDQGLPVLKAIGFGEAVNITLGLPIIRTSVDHGTALALAGTGDASSSSLEAAIRLARQACAVPLPVAPTADTLTATDVAHSPTT